MPMYQYACNGCGQDFEKKLRMSQSGETQACPCCGGMETRKRIGAVAFSGGASNGRALSAAPTAPVSSPFT